MINDKTIDLCQTHFPLGKWKILDGEIINEQYPYKILKNTWEEPVDDDLYAAHLYDANDELCGGTDVRQPSDLVSFLRTYYKHELDIQNHFSDHSNQT